MNTLTRNTPLGTLGLPAGDHWVKFHVEGDVISFEVAASLPPPVTGLEAPATRASAARAFVEKWSGRGQLLSDAEMAGDARLVALTARHLR